LKSESSGGQEADKREREKKMSEGVEVTAINKRDEKRASKVWTSCAMHIAADSSTETGGRGGKSIESLSKNEREKRASVKRERDRKEEKEGRHKNEQGTEEERYLSLSSLSLSLSSRVAETMRSIVECPLVDMRIPYLLSCTARL